MLNWLTANLHRWLAPDCAGCGRTITDPSNGPFCEHCLDHLPTNSHACVRCAEPLLASAPSPSLCAHCLTRMPAFDRVFAPLLYAAPVDTCIHALKYRGDLGGARRLAALLNVSLPWLPSPDVVVPVPLHHSRLRQRGFNQALEIAKPLCRRRGWHLNAAAVTRARPTRPQLGLSASERLRNLKGAFVVQTDISGQRVCILDDVLTTGATASALASVLLAAGAGEVIVVAAARTPHSTAPQR